MKEVESKIHICSHKQFPPVNLNQMQLSYVVRFQRSKIFICRLVRESHNCKMETHIHIERAEEKWQDRQQPIYGLCDI